MTAPKGTPGRPGTHNLTATACHGVGMNAWKDENAFLSEVRRSAFFSRVGQCWLSHSLPDDAKGAVVRPRPSKAIALRTTVEPSGPPTVEAAAAAFLSPKWEDFRHEARNLLGLAVRQQSARAFDVEWNKVVTAVEQRVVQLAKEKARSFPGGPAADDIAWDLLGTCCEIHFRDIVPPGFFTLLSRCYLQGFLPFGWNGNFPNGCLLVCTDGTPLTEVAVRPESGMSLGEGKPAAKGKGTSESKPAAKKKPTAKKPATMRPAKGKPAAKKQPKR